MVLVFVEPKLGYFMTWYSSVGGFPDGSAVKNPPDKQETWVPSPGQEDPLEKEIATHCSILAWEIPWTEEPGELQSTGSQRVGQDSMTKLQSRGRQEEWKPVCGRKFISSPVINYSGFQVSHLWLGILMSSLVFLPWGLNAVHTSRWLTSPITFQVNRNFLIALSKSDHVCLSHLATSFGSWTCWKALSRAVCGRLAAPGNYPCTAEGSHPLMAVVSRSPDSHESLWYWDGTKRICSRVLERSLPD